MEEKGTTLGGAQGSGQPSGESANKPEVVTLEGFITANWQILTIFGVFAGFTNYMKGIENDWLVTLGFFMTFVVELEILIVLLKIKNGSLLLRAFTLLSGLFIIIFGGFIYSAHISGLLSGLGVAVMPLVSEHRVLLLRTIFFASGMIIVLGLYRYLNSMTKAALKRIGGTDRLPSVRTISIILVLAVAVILVAGFIITPEGTGPAEATITSTTSTTTTTQPTTTTNPAATTTTITAETVCTTNSDCGNQTLTRICYQNDVYIQQETPLCQHPGTPEARCITKTGLQGEGISQSATPTERCTQGCKDGECT